MAYAAEQAAYRASPEYQRRQREEAAADAVAYAAKQAALDARRIAARQARGENPITYQQAEAYIAAQRLKDAEEMILRRWNAEQVGNAASRAEYARQTGNFLPEPTREQLQERFNRFRAAEIAENHKVGAFRNIAFPPERILPGPPALAPPGFWSGYFKKGGRSTRRSSSPRRKAGRSSSSSRSSYTRRRRA